MSVSDREIEREVIREHLRVLMEDTELDPKVRIQAMQLLGKDIGMWAQDAAAGAVSLQVLIADMREARVTEARVTEDTRT